MANLIIKSSADNLVLQGSDASPAITVGATGTTTFAENATLSGSANNLGTSTAGTLSSGVTFPAGHILQVVQTKTTAATTINSDSDTGVTGFSASITPSKTSSKILFSMFPITYVGFTGSTKYPTLYSKIYRDSTLIHTQGRYYYAGTAGNGYMEMGTNHDMQYLDSPNTTSAVVYSVKANRSNVAVSFYWKVDSILTLMEVAG